MSYSSEVLADSALVYWRLGEAGTPATAVDASGNGRDGSYAYGTTGVPRLTLGTPGLLTGDSDTAATFAGANWFDPGYVSIAHAAWMDVSAITLECWIKTTATGFQMLWDRDPGGSSNRPWQFRLNNGKFEFVRVCNSAGGVAAVTASSTIAVNDGARHHLVATYDGSTIKLYIDGALNNTVTASGGLCVTSTDGLRFGLSQGGQGCYTGGVGDELAYYGTVLSATRIAAHYTAGTTAPSGTYTGTLAATAPRATIALTGTYTAATAINYTSALSATAPNANAVLTGTYSGAAGVVDYTGTLAAKAPAAFATLSGTYTGTIGTDTTNRAGGIDIRATAIATYEPPVVEPPVTLQVAYSTDTAVPLPVPIMVNGRPSGAAYQAAIRLAQFKPGGRDRVLIGGKDVTFFRGVPVFVPGYTLSEPLAYDASTLVLPQVNPLFETLGVGELKFARHGAHVKFQRVYADGSVVTDYVGRVLSLRSRGGALELGIGGQISGPAGLLDEQPPAYWHTHDVGWWAFNATRPFCHMTPRFGPDTGIRLPKTGGMTRLAWIQQVCAESQEGGKQRAIMPATWGVNDWRFDFKDTTTVHATIFVDGTRVVDDLVDDVTERPNTFYGTGTTPDGMRVRNIRWPGLQKAPAPPFPMASGAAFGIGTTNADTVDGSGITVLQIKLQWEHFIDQDDYTHGTYDAATAAGVKRLQRRVNLPRTGEVDTATWKRLFNDAVAGYELTAARAFPMVQDSRIGAWDYSEDGSIVGPNADYDPTMLEVDETIDFDGVHKSRMHDVLEHRLERSQSVKNLAGTITLNGVGGFAGKWELGDTPPASAVMGMRDFRPGMNVWLPGVWGGTLMHVSGAPYSPGQPGSATLYVDTQARDLMELSEIIKRNRQSRRNIRREWNRENRGHKASNSLITFDEFGGILDHDRRLQGGQWNIIGLIAGQTGVLERIDLQLLNNKAEFCFAVLSEHISAARMRRRVGNPFPVNANGESVWETESLADWFADKTILYAAGDEQQPCGYGNRRKFSDKTDANGDPIRTDAPITGHFRDDAGVPYRTPSNHLPLLWLAIYPDRDCTLQSGRLLYKSEDDAV